MLSILAIRAIRPVRHVRRRAHNRIQHAAVHSQRVQGDRHDRQRFADRQAISVHRLAGAGRAQVGRRVHRLYRTGAQDERAVRPRGSDHRPLQVLIHRKTVIFFKRTLYYPHVLSLSF